jgi:hypothetical protein
VNLCQKVLIFLAKAFSALRACQASSFGNNQTSKKVSSKKEHKFAKKIVKKRVR